MRRANVDRILNPKDVQWTQDCCFNLKRTLCVSTIVISLLLVNFVLIPPNSAGFDSDIILGGSDTLTVSGFESCFNITLRGESTLIIKNANFKVDGIIRMSEYSRLFVFKSKLELCPPALDDDVIVISLEGNSMIRVSEGSEVIFNPQPSATNISYMLMEDNTQFFLIDSVFRGYLPSIINQSIEVASVTAGVYLLSGSASWYMFDSYVEGSVSLIGGELTGRWFWCTLHQKASLHIEETDLNLVSMPASYTVLKPVSGTTTIINSRILGGKVDVEVAAQTVMDNSTFNYMVRFMDSSSSQVTNCTFQEDVSVGTTLAVSQGDYNPETVIELAGTTFMGRLRCVGNSTTSAFESHFNGLYAGLNATVLLRNSTIKEHLSVRDQSNVVISDCKLESVLVDGTASLNLKGSPDISSMTFYANSKYQRKGTIYLEQINVSSSIIQSDFNNSITFCSANLGLWRFYNNISVTLELVNSSVETISPLRSGENVTMTFIIVNTTVPDLLNLNINITVHIYYRLTVKVCLNEEPLDTTVEVFHGLNKIHKESTQGGMVSFDLHYKTRLMGVVTTTLNYQVYSSYLAISETKSVVLVSSMTLIFNWFDKSAPIISNMTTTPLEWNLGKDITVRINSMDSGVGSVGDTTLFYRMDDGEWKQIRMFKIGNDTYEAMIPKFSESGTLSFYVQSEDRAGNIAKTQEKRLEVGQKENMVYLGGIIALILVISFFIAKRVFVGRKIKKYAGKYQFNRNLK